MKKFAAIFGLLSGFAMSAAGFYVEPMGEISSSVLVYTGQAFTLSAAAMGIDIIIDNKLTNILNKK